MTIVIARSELHVLPNIFVHICSQTSLKMDGGSRNGYLILQLQIDKKLDLFDRLVQSLTLRSNASYLLNSAPFW